MHGVHVSLGQFPGRSAVLRARPLGGRAYERCRNT